MDEAVPSIPRKPRGKGRASGKGGGNAKDSDSSGRNESAAEKLARQIFVGGLPSSITQEKFREWADETWPGTVTHVQVIYTFQERHHHARPRGFGFITFRDAGCVDNALEIRHRPFGAKIVELKKAEDCRGKKGRSGKKESGSSSSTTGEQMAQSQKQESLSPSYPPGPAELLTTSSALDGATSKGHGTDEGSSLAADSSPCAGGESQGPLHAAGHQDFPLRQQNCPQPSQGPQCVAISSNDSSSRRSGRRVSGANSDRSGRESATVVQSEERGGQNIEGAQTLHENFRRISCSDSGADSSVDGSVGPASPTEVKTSRPMYDDSIRQLLRERWDAAVGS
uniref:RRM domain-containing protein n=1 Tax=Cryptomonas curvata TaxID=233186 RepID=A0A7S0QLP5_9CRYP|mmetsp:Transcript_34672/g.72717  ORF Transcript_34672/g.72717 Transcript_34672/m.72717 type:complete len:339 (+) Transcript_34672:217-1233(+)